MGSESGSVGAVSISWGESGSAISASWAQAAQAQNRRSYMFFFLLICERSAKRDMGHILLPNNRIGSREK